MQDPNLGYNKSLFILAFDHRGSFQAKMFGIKGRAPTADENKMIASYKAIIYDGFKKAVGLGVPKSEAGILVDEEFGSEILKDAKAQGFTFACPAEKSGQDEFDFEFGDEFGAHIHKFRPNFVKVLVRYNPEGDSVSNKRQLERLKRLSDYCHKNNQKFLFELLVGATPEQLKKAGGDSKKFDHELRPAYTVQAMKDILAFGIEPDVWKLEGVETKEQAAMFSTQAHAGGRTNVGVVILGRGENDEKVRHWLSVAAQVPGYIGFAVGRTIFWDALTGFKEGRYSRDQAVDKCAQNYLNFYKTWKSSS